MNLTPISSPNHSERLESKTYFVPADDIRIPAGCSKRPCSPLEGWQPGTHPGIPLPGLQSTPQGPTGIGRRNPPEEQAGADQID